MESIQTVVSGSTEGLLGERQASTTLTAAASGPITISSDEDSEDGSDDSIELSDVEEGSDVVSGALPALGFLSASHAFWNTWQELPESAALAMRALM